MKRTLLRIVIILLVCATTARSQDFTLIINGSDFYPISNAAIQVKASKATSMAIKSNKNTGKNYRFYFGEVYEPFAGDGQSHALTASQYTIPGDHYSIVEIADDGTVADNATYSFSLAVSGGNTTGNAAIQLPAETIEEFWRSEYSTVRSTRYGLVISNGNTNYKGNEYTHIFFDQYGNNIFSAIPPGIPERQYVVHIIYLAPDANSGLMYDISETSGGFNPTLNIQNADIRSQLGALVTNAVGSDNTPTTQTVKYKWYDKEKLLSTSTDDIGIDLNRILVKPDTIYSFSKTKIGSYTIKMTTVYNISMDVGLINSHLENPTYQLQPSPADPTQNVVKKSNGGDRGIITVMATFYTSPVVLFKKYIQKKNIPNYKIWGRNYLDDHSLFERIYPSLGVGFTDNTLQNLFYGINWELVRGGALFIGGHYGVVNTFSAPANFVYGQTTMTQADFTLRQNTEWKSGFAIGFKVDVKVVTSLFGSKNS